jgi:hypothetical protein
MALASAQGHWRGQKSLSPLWKARFSLSTPSIGPRYGFPLLKIIISRNIYRMGTLIVIMYLRRSLWLFRNPPWFHKSCVFLSYVRVQWAAERNIFGVGV